MGRWTAISDVDYFDEPWNRPIRCAHPECDQQADEEGWLCRDCEREDAARAARERERREAEQRQKESA